MTALLCLAVQAMAQVEGKPADNGIDWWAWGGLAGLVLFIVLLNFVPDSKKTSYKAPVADDEKKRRRWWHRSHSGDSDSGGGSSYGGGSYGGGGASGSW